MELPVVQQQIDLNQTPVAMEQDLNAALEIEDPMEMIINPAQDEDQEEEEQQIKAPPQVHQQQPVGDQHAKVLPQPQQLQSVAQPDIQIPDQFPILQDQEEELMDLDGLANQAKLEEGQQGHPVEHLAAELIGQQAVND